MYTFQILQNTYNLEIVCYSTITVLTLNLKGNYRNDATNNGRRKYYILTEQTKINFYSYVSICFLSFVFIFALRKYKNIFFHHSEILNFSTNMYANKVKCK